MGQQGPKTIELENEGESHRESELLLHYSLLFLVASIPTPHSHRPSFAFNIPGSILLSVSPRNMSLILRLRHRLQSGFPPKPYLSQAIASKPLNPSPTSRGYAQPAVKELEEEIDPRQLPADYDPSNFDPSSHRSPPTDRVFRLVEEVSSLTLLEVAELSSLLMEKLGMKEPPVVGVMKPGALAGLAGMMAKGPTAAAQEEKKEEKTVFELKLESYEAASKIKVIKEIRGFTELGLKEAKELVEKSPAIFKTGVAKEEAQQIIEKLKAVGARVWKDLQSSRRLVPIRKSRLRLADVIHVMNIE
ncbi:hypothetical protein V2J09_016178 [Rumex salicifolius]